MGLNKLKSISKIPTNIVYLLLFSFFARFYFVGFDAGFRFYSDYHGLSENNFYEKLVGQVNSLKFVFTFLVFIFVESFLTYPAALFLGFLYYLLFFGFFLYDSSPAGLYFVICAQLLAFSFTEVSIMQLLSFEVESMKQGGFGNFNFKTYTLVTQLAYVFSFLFFSVQAPRFKQIFVINVIIWSFNLILIIFYLSNLGWKGQVILNKHIHKSRQNHRLLFDISVLFFLFVMGFIFVCPLVGFLLDKLFIYSVLGLILVLLVGYFWLFYITKAHQIGPPMYSQLLIFFLMFLFEFSYFIHDDCISNLQSSITSYLVRLPENFSEPGKNFLYTSIFGIRCAKLICGVGTLFVSFLLYEFCLKYLFNKLSNSLIKLKISFLFYLASQLGYILMYSYYGSNKISYWVYLLNHFLFAGPAYFIAYSESYNCLLKYVSIRSLNIYCTLLVTLSNSSTELCSGKLISHFISIPDIASDYNELKYRARRVNEYLHFSLNLFISASFFFCLWCVLYFLFLKSYFSKIDSILRNTDKEIALGEREIINKSNYIYLKYMKRNNLVELQSEGGNGDPNQILND